MNAIPFTELDILREAVIRILDRTFGGLHHVEGWKRREETPDPYPTIRLTHYGGMSTFDFSILTMLVIGAHDEHVRLDVRPASPKYIRLSFSLRQREGSIAERHPTIEQAIANYRKDKPA